MSELDDYENSRISDLYGGRIPECLYWSSEQVCEFFDASLNLPQYKETLRANNIDGRRLIYLDATHLPKIGVNDFEHIKIIAKSVRELLKMNAPYWNRSVSDLPRDIMELYYEAKSVSGKKSNKLNYEDFSGDTADSKWQPPLTNQGLILPRF